MLKTGPFRRTSTRDIIDAVYGAIVAQARAPAFYRDYGVPDSVTGRLEMIVIHTFLFFRRARRGSEGLRRVGQGVFDLFCSDMDANLREMGVGDLAVPKQMRHIGEAFYGRAAAYDAALDAADEHALTQALVRNVFAASAQQPERARRLAGYVNAAAAQLASEEDATLAMGRIGFPNPEAF